MADNSLVAVRPNGSAVISRALVSIEDKLSQMLNLMLTSQNNHNTTTTTPQHQEAIATTISIKIF